MTPLHIVHLEDSAAEAKLLWAKLREGGIECETVRVDTRTDYEGAIATCPDLILADYSLPGFDGYTALNLAAAKCPDVPFLFVSGALGEERAIELMKAGATDYVLKQHPERLVPAVQRALREARERRNRRQAETALRASEGRFRQLAEALPQVLFTTAADGQCDYVNRYWIEYTGLSLDDTRGLKWDVVFHIDDRERHVEHWLRSVAVQQPFESVARIRRASDGMFRWHIIRAVPIRDHHGHVVQWIGLANDIHDQKIAEQERERLLLSERSARRDAETANRMKDEFLANLSHELRTPLNAILGYATLLMMDESLASELREGLEVIERNAKLQAQLIEDLLDVSRIISGKLRLDVQPLDLCEIVRAALVSVMPAANARQLEVVEELDCDLGPVAGDASRLQQVFWNLLSNAIKFTPERGQVVVKVTGNASHAEVTVRDNGMGIEPEFLPYVFDRFRQADASTKRTHSGLGLGLAIVRQLVDLHGGAVSVDSQGRGLGATFCVRLPLKASARTESDASAIGGELAQADDDKPSLSLQGVRVLIVDDEADARRMASRVLTRSGADVQEAGSVVEAIEILTDAQPHVLVSDIAMPRQDGYDLIRQVRQHFSGRELPAVALTAFARTEDRRRALLSGFQLHIAKPVDPHELAAAVASLAGRTNDGWRE